MLNRYKGNYDFVLYQNVSTWVNLIVNKRKADKRKKEVEREDAERENLENKTTANHILVYTKQPTTKNTKAGDVVLYENEVWLNKGNVFTAIPLRDLDGYIDKDGTILKLPTKNYANEKVEETLKENTMENYIVINGKKAELTEEQLKQLGIEIENKRNNPFNDRPKVDDIFYYITSDGVRLNDDDDYNADMITVTNSFNDGIFAKQVALHQLLYRKLLKYAYDNNAEVTEKDLGCDNDNPKYFIYCELYHNTFHVDSEAHTVTLGMVHFKDESVAEQAIKDVVEPFIKEHPKFVWQ